VTTLRYSLQNKQFVILMKISSKMAFENFKNFISFHETFKTKFSTHISSYVSLHDLSLYHSQLVILPCILVTTRADN